MPAWVYKARDAGGRLVQGRVDAESERDLVSRLRHQGLLVLGVEKDRDLQRLVQSQGSLFNPKPKTNDMAIFSRQFATMIASGLPVVTTLRVLARQTANRRLQQKLEAVAADVEAGEDLTSAFARQGKFFPVIMVQMIGAGEVGGILDEVLNRTAVHLEKEESTRRKVKSALIYPSVVSCVAVLVVTFLMVFVIPRFVELYSDMGAALPLPTQMLLKIGNTVRSYWWAMGGGLGLAIAGFQAWLHTEKGRLTFDQWVLRLPIFGPMLTKQAIARFARTLGGLMASGVPILKAMAVVERTVGNKYVGAAVIQAMEAVRQGQPLVAALLQSPIFPPMVTEMVSVGEETGTVDRMLHKIADFYEEDVQRTAEGLSASLEPIIIVVLAVVVGFIVISMMLPVFNLWSTVGQM